MLGEESEAAEVASPRDVNIGPGLLSTSRRKSGRWRSSSSSGLSMLQFEGSANNENRRKEERMCRH